MPKKNYPPKQTKKEKKEKIKKKIDQDKKKEEGTIKNKEINKNSIEDKQNNSKDKIDIKINDDKDIEMKSENEESKAESIPKMENSEINLYIKEYKAYSNIISNLTDSDTEREEKNKKKKQKIKKEIKNAKDENLSLEDAINDIEKNEPSINLEKNRTFSKNKTIKTNDSKKNLEIEIKGNRIKYNNRIFIFNLNASKYQKKEERKIYYCQYHYRHINELRKHNKEPFCNMKITFYPNKDEDEQFKITGGHTYECLKLYNENRSDKKIYLESYENFKEKCFEEFNKKIIIIEKNL